MFALSIPCVRPTCENIMRAGIFQLAVRNHGLMERLFNHIFDPDNDHKGFCKKGYDPVRGQFALEAFKVLGAEEYDIAVKGSTTVNAYHFRSERLREIIVNLGGEWEKIEIEEEEGNKTIVAIIPPSESSKDWEAFVEATKKMKWEMREVTIDGEEKQVIVTCEHGDLIPDDASRSIIFHTNFQSNALCMNGRRIGSLLGTGVFDFVGHDNPGIGHSTSERPSEGENNLALKKVYTCIIKKYDFPVENTWFSGACGGIFPPAALKADPQLKLHEQGVNCIFERSVYNLREQWPLNRLVKLFIDTFWYSLADNHPSSTQPKETGYDVEKSWENLEESSKGKTIIVSIENDQRVSREVTADFVELASCINEKTFDISYTSLNTKNPHFTEYHSYEAPSRQVLKAIFS